MEINIEINSVRNNHLKALATTSQVCSDISRRHIWSQIKYSEVEKSYAEEKSLLIKIRKIFCLKIEVQQIEKEASHSKISEFRLLGNEIETQPKKTEQVVQTLEISKDVFWNCWSEQKWYSPKTVCER